MVRNNYYDDHRFCPACQFYVRFLLSPEAGYCVECGGRVRVFSPAHLLDFRSSNVSVVLGYEEQVRSSPQEHTTARPPKALAE